MKQLPNIDFSKNFDPIKRNYDLYKIRTLTGLYTKQTEKINDIEPRPAYLKNMETGEFMYFNINPESLGSEIQSEWEEIPIYGMPNVPMNYKITKNQPFYFTLVINRMYLQRKSKKTMDEIRSQIKSWRAFLHSLVLPVDKYHSKGWVGGEPPKVWFNWNNVVSTYGRITNVQWRITNFDVFLASNHELVDITFVSDLPAPVWSDEMKFTGWELV